MSMQNVVVCAVYYFKSTVSRHLEIARKLTERTDNILECLWVEWEEGGFAQYILFRIIDFISSAV